MEMGSAMSQILDIKAVFELSNHDAMPYSMSSLGPEDCDADALSTLGFPTITKL